MVGVAGAVIPPPVISLELMTAGVPLDLPLVEGGCLLWGGRGGLGGGVWGRCGLVAAAAAASEGT